MTAPKRDEKDAGAALSDAERRAQYLQQLQFGGEDVSKIAETCALLAANTRTGNVSCAGGSLTDLFFCL